LYWGKHCSFPHKTLSIAIMFFLTGFFPSKIIFVDFFYIKLVENLVLYFFSFLLTEKLNHVAKALYFSSQNSVDCYKSFYSVSKFLITNTTFFFPSWNIGSIIPLVSITYLALQFWWWIGHVTVRRSRFESLGVPSVKSPAKTSTLANRFFF